MGCLEKKDIQDCECERVISFICDDKGMRQVIYSETSPATREYGTYIIINVKQFFDES
jgi:hypothetical protein